MKFLFHLDQTNKQTKNYSVKEGPINKVVYLNEINS